MPTHCPACGDVLLNWWPITSPRFGPARVTTAGKNSPTGFTRIADPDDAFDVAGNQLGFDVGGGVSANVGKRLRFQADARYFRTLQGRQPADEFDLAIHALSFWRTVVGIGYRF